MASTRSGDGSALKTAATLSLTKRLPPSSPLRAPSAARAIDDSIEEDKRSEHSSFTSSTRTGINTYDKNAAHMIYMAKQHERMVRQAALQAAQQRYSKRFVILADFWWDVLRKIEWKKSFRAAIEISSGYATVASSPTSGSKINYGALNTAFWNAACIPRGVTLPIPMVDDHLKKVFQYFDVEASDAIDYRDLLAAIPLFHIDILEPAYRLLRSWYRAYDADATGGVPVELLTQFMSTLATKDAHSWAISRFVTTNLDRLVSETQMRRTTEKTMNDKLADYAQALRLSKRFGPEYVKEVIPESEMPPDAFPPVWSPYDVALRRADQSARVVHIDVLVEWLANDKELLKEIQSQRLIATHPTQRAKYEENERVKHFEETMKRIEKEKTPKADAHRRAVMLAVVLNAWNEYLSRNKIIRSNIDLMGRIRSVRHWRNLARNRNEMRLKLRKAHDFMAKQLVKRLYGYWVAFRKVEIAKGAVARRRAERYHEAAIQEKAFQALRNAAQEGRAIQHYKMTLQTRYFVCWGAVHSRAALKNATKVPAIVHVQPSDVKVTVQELLAKADEEKEKKALAEELRQRQQDYEEFIKIAKEEEAAMLAAAALYGANQRVTVNRKLEQQAKERRQYKAAQKEERRLEFEKRWKERIAQAMREEKAKQMRWLTKTKAGRSTVRAGVRQLTAAKEIEEVSQEYSDFTTYINMEDGCFHFVKQQEDGTKIEINVDAMTVVEAMQVVAAHHAAKKACELRNELLIEKQQDWELQLKENAAKIIQRAYVARRVRIEELSRLRDRLELLCDPFTRELYYWDKHTGNILKYPLEFMGTVFLLHPLPDWALSITHAANGDIRKTYVRIHPPPDHYIAIVETKKRQKLMARTARGANASSSTTRPTTAGINGEQTGQAALEIPFTINELAGPPAGYLLCTVCGSDFAWRTCRGDGCHEHLYCYTCFTAYHPIEDARWASHWDPAWSTRIYVKPGGLPNQDELLLMRGIQPVDAVPPMQLLAAQARRMESESPTRGRLAPLPDEDGPEADSDISDEEEEPASDEEEQDFLRAGIKQWKMKGKAALNQAKAAVTDAQGPNIKAKLGALTGGRARK